MTTPENPVLVEVAALRRELKLTWEGHTREHEQHDKAHQREHEFTAEALKVAADLAKENKAAANEWRGSMNDREARFATKEDVRTLHVAIEALEKAAIERIDKVERSDLIRDERERTTLVEQAKALADSDRRNTRNQWIAGVAVTFVVILVNLVIRLLTP